MELRKKLRAAVILLLVCLILLVSASYAWLTISRAPEVTSIETNIGANGSLEIALLSSETYIDPSLIRTTVGDSAVVQETVISNLSWGNVIDLTDESYGLSKISLRPSRLNVSGSGDGSSAVGSNLLMLANFGIDGRITSFSSETVSAVLAEDNFTYDSENQSYGVRAIGSISGMTSQQTALATARTAVQAYTASAQRATEAAWESNGTAITDLFFSAYSLRSSKYSSDDVAVILDTARRMQTALSYVDLALRHGIIGVAASELEDEEQFESVYSIAINTSIPLSMLTSSLPSGVPGELKSWITKVDEMRAEVQQVIFMCDRLPAEPTWEQLEPLISVLVNADKAYMGNERLSTRDAFSAMTEDNILTLGPAAGVMAQIAAYSGNYNAFYMWNNNISVEVVSSASNDKAYLTEAYELIADSEAAGGGESDVITADLNEIYGYAVDMAFRCNAPSDLLLQTAAAQRVQSEESLSDIQGDGSYMRFSSKQLDDEQLVYLMDTLRIGFMNDKNELIALAKLNTSNYEDVEGEITAPLYLYEYSVNSSGSVIPGERRSEDRSIVPLDQNVPTVITVIVWLDGDYVNNNMVGITPQTMTGILNLQFASSADLNMADLEI